VPGRKGACVNRDQEEDLCLDRVSVLEFINKNAPIPTRNVPAHLVAGTQEVAPRLHAWLSEAIPEMPPKAERWSKDMDGICQTLQQAGGTGLFHAGAAQVYSGIGKVDRSFDQLADILDTIERLAAHIAARSGTGKWRMTQA
jgi:hypothetical protein